MFGAPSVGSSETASLRVSESATVGLIGTNRKVIDTKKTGISFKFFILRSIKRIDHERIWMSWTSILTALTLSTTSAILVIIYGWELWQAFSVVAAFSVGLILMLLAILMWMSPAQDRASVLQVVKVGFLKEFEALLKNLRGK